MEMKVTITINVGDEIKNPEDRILGRLGRSDCSRMFSSDCIGWCADRSVNMAFLKTQQRYLSDKLKHIGHLYLNEVYDCLGIPRTNYGQFIGWIYEEGKIVDFGIEETADGDADILLNFNVDGLIIDRV